MTATRGQVIMREAHLAVRRGVKPLMHIDPNIDTAPLGPFIKKHLVQLTSADQWSGVQGVAVEFATQRRQANVSGDWTLKIHLLCGRDRELPNQLLNGLLGGLGALEFPVNRGTPPGKIRVDRSDITKEGVAGILETAAHIYYPLYHRPAYHSLWFHLEAGLRVFDPTISPEVIAYVHRAGRYGGLNQMQYPSVDFWDEATVDSSFQRALNNPLAVAVCTFTCAVYGGKESNPPFENDQGAMCLPTGHFLTLLPDLVNVG